MRIGRADRRVTIERATYTTNGYGERVASWATVTTVWAELMKSSGIGESITNNAQDVARQTLFFKVRSSNTTRGIKADDRLKYGTRYYDIKGVEEIGRLSELIIVCETTTT
jgi:SPP1 family predicted phage head-tail adaptor